jgi:hypothetical protein
MRMLRALVSGLMLLMVGLPSFAGKPFTNADLNGSYLFILTQIRTENVGGTPVTNYCENAGTIAFDGAGAVTVNSVRRCSATGTVVDVGAFVYAVNADGSFLVDETPVFADPVHGQIVDRGAHLLLDGTARTNPDIMIFHGVAMRR